jgi:arginase family enzyme
MKTTAVIFPFDLFGSSATGAGAALVADELREVLADNRRESVPTRARAYTEHVRIREFAFETLADYENWRRQGRRAVRSALGRGDFLLWITGNHLGALPVYDELSGQNDHLVVQFDAHLDIHNFHNCATELTHGNFLLHCDGPLPPLVNAGHRELLLTPEYIGRFFHRAFSAAELAIDPMSALGSLREAAGAASQVFLDIDCDVFDPAFFPAIGQPVPFGISPAFMLRLIDAVWGDNVAGVCVSEFDPGRDRDDRSLATIIWLLEYLLLRRYE